MTVNRHIASRTARLATSAMALASAVGACGPTPAPATPSGPVAEARTPAALTPSPAATQPPAPTLSARPSPTPAVVSLRWDALSGAVAAFSDASLTLTVRGPQGVVGFGADRASGLPLAWTTDDGIHWTRMPLAPTTFGGGAPRSVAFGPAGWLAIGWRITPADPYGAALWRSDDGIHWEAADDA